MFWFGLRRVFGLLVDIGWPGTLGQMKANLKRARSRCFTRRRMPARIFNAGTFCWHAR
jgi:hypothetical protein